jgi:hypothetical protein
MYQSLLFAIKRRILDECEAAFQQHPAFSDKVIVRNKFPYEERLQYGVLLRNTSASMVRVSPDNYISDLLSHIRLARQGNYPGLSIEWVRENENGITRLVKEEDVSSQLDPTQRMFLTQYPICSGPGNTQYANNIGQVRVTVNGTQVFPEYVNGERSLVMLNHAPDAGAVVKVTYYRRYIADPGLYYIDFIDATNFVIAPIFIIDGEVLEDKTTGTEITVSLAHNRIEPNSLILSLQIKGAEPIYLVEGTDYSIDILTGVITFLVPVLSGYQMLADYRYQPVSYNNGPYTINPYQEVHDVIPGVVLSVGRRVAAGDRQIIVISEFREPQARIYGGHWEVSLELAVISKDTIQVEEMTDQLISYIWGIRKGYLEHEGITINSMEPTGESEETFVESTGDLYYTQSVSINLQSEWQQFVPYTYEINRIIPNIQYTPETNDYTVSRDLKVTVSDIQPDPRPVIKYPTMGYEKLA